MADVLLSPADPNSAPAATSAGWSLAVVLAIWFALVCLLAAGKAFVSQPGTPPIGIALGATVPVLAFVLSLRSLPSFRDFVMGADLRLLTGIQAWRFAGFGFLALTVQGVLPGAFAWPAGLGDMAIGLTAPVVVMTLLHRPEFASGWLFRVWNLLGILDLVVAVGTGGLIAASTAAGAGAAPMQAMAGLPLVLVPAYLVPIFVMLHLAALMQQRRATAR